jgi:DNA-binding Lrp family transcriptional regulator
MKLDSIDIKIIKLLQKNARTSIASIARNLGISKNATRARYKKIQKSGIIKKTFNPTFLPQYALGKGQTYKMQLIIRSTNKQTENLVKLIKGFNLERSQIECLETIGHYNIFVWIISENPIDLQFVKDRVLSQPGVLEVKVCILKDMLDFYSQINLDHLGKREKNG